MPLPFTPQCIITGCDLYFPDINKRAHGDLFALGSCYIFNAVLREGEAMLLDADGLADKYIEFNHMTIKYFERRGVFVVHKSAVKFSPAAERHVAVWSAA